MNIPKSRLYLVIGTIAILAIGLVFVISNYSSARKGTVERESNLNAQYQANQTQLSSFVSGFYEQTGLAKAKSEKLNEILTAAVKGRYDENSSAKPGGGQLFSAMTEAYPDLKQLDIYDQIVSYVQSGREGYRQAQNKLLDMLREYETFRKSDIVRTQFVKLVGAPTNDLVARIGKNSTRGQEALDQMYLIVLDQQTKQAYEDGEMAPLTVE